MVGVQVSGALRSLPSASVVVRFNGAVLAPRDGVPTRQVTLVDLLLLTALTPGADGDPAPLDDALDAVAAEAGATLDEVRESLDALRLRGMVGPSDTPVREIGSRPAAPKEPSVALDADQALALRTPLVLRLDGDGFAAVDAEGRRAIHLSPREVLASVAFASSTTLADAAPAGDALGLSSDDLAQLVGRLFAAGLLRWGDDASPQDVTAERGQREMRQALARVRKLRRAVDADLAAADAEEAARAERTGTTRVAVVPIHHHGTYVPLGLGMILAYLDAHPSPRLHEHFRTRRDWIAGERDIDELTRQPAVYLFSNYLWSHSRNLERSAAIKAASPGSITIHGGPDTPSYEADARDYFRANPHVDITVRGEGEATVADVLEALAGSVGGDEPVDLSVLADVPGITFRQGDDVVRTADRERLADLNVVPSPFLAGVFDAYRGIAGLSVVLETNRGCPYGCTFCDWGSATKSRIRKFDLDRVMAELEWCATAEATGVSFADANFGIFERDVDIASRVVQLKAEHGYPLMCSGSYAKNTVKHLEHIIGMWVDAGMLSLGVLSLQTMDPGTLEAVKRSNIKTEKYDLLARQFRTRGLPLYVDLMMGLPGMTLESFLDDLQSCIDREVQAKIHETLVLPNSPMNAPAYREEHKLQIRRPAPPGSPERSGIIVATSSASEADVQRMEQIRPLYLLAENMGVLRHVARYVRHETGAREVDVYLAVLEAAEEAPSRWPSFEYLLHSAPLVMGPPGSWELLLEEAHELVVERFGVLDDDALRAVLEVQRLVLPTVGRPERLSVELAHDYAAWHEAMIQAKLDGVEWTDVVPPLRQLGPATFTADDPLHLGDRLLGGRLSSAWFDAWELESPVARPSVLNALSSSEEDLEPVPTPA